MVTKKNPGIRKSGNQKFRELGGTTVSSIQFTSFSTLQFQAVIIEKSINDLKDEPSEENDEKVFEEDIRKEIDKILHVEVLHDVPEDELSYEYLSLSIQNRLKLEQESKQEKNPSNLGKLGDQLSKLSKTVKNHTCIEE